MKMTQILQLPPTKAIRLIFKGRVLEDQHTLSRCGIKNNSSVHCNVSERIPSEVRRQMQQQSSQHVISSV